LFTIDKPIIFAFHGYPWLVHRLTYRRTNHNNLHVRGYKEEGTTSTPFDMVVMNDLDRYHLFGDVIDRLPQLGARAAYARQAVNEKLLEHTQYIAEHGDDMPEVTGWRWGRQKAVKPAKAAKRATSTEGDNVYHFACSRRPLRGSPEPRFGHQLEVDEAHVAEAIVVPERRLVEPPFSLFAWRDGGLSSACAATSRSPYTTPHFVAQIGWGALLSEHAEEGDGPGHDGASNKSSHSCGRASRASPMRCGSPGGARRPRIHAASSVASMPQSWQILERYAARAAASAANLAADAGARALAAAPSGGMFPSRPSPAARALVAAGPSRFRKRSPHAASAVWLPRARMSTSRGSATTAAQLRAAEPSCCTSVTAPHVRNRRRAQHRDDDGLYAGDGPRWAHACGSLDPARSSIFLMS
jgi:hypothetical protein